MIASYRNSAQMDSRDVGHEKRKAQLRPLPRVSISHGYNNSPKQELSPLVIQRYPVRVSGTQLTATSGRPAVPSSEGFIRKLVNRIYTSSHHSAAEEDLISTHRPEQAISALKNGGYRSANRLAFCHKISIDDVEGMLVNFANGSTSKADVEDLLDRIEVDTALLDRIENTSDMNEKKNLVNQLIRLVNNAPANYYLGDGPSNSSIQNHFDAHIDYETGEMSPISDYMYDHQGDFGITPPRGDEYGEYSSSFTKWWG